MVRVNVVQSDLWIVQGGPNPNGCAGWMWRVVQGGWSWLCRTLTLMVAGWMDDTTKKFPQLEAYLVEYSTTCVGSWDKLHLHPNAWYVGQCTGDRRR